MATRIKKVRRGKGAGNIFKIEDLKKNWEAEFSELAKLIKEFIIAEAEKGGRHKFRKDGKDSFVNGIDVEAVPDGVEIELAEQAYYIEQGRRPLTKKVPIAALVKWIKRYRVVSRDKKTGKFKKVSESSINATAWAIQQSIYKNGIKPRPFIQATLDFVEELISQMIEDVMLPDLISVVEFKLGKK